MLRILVIALLLAMLTSLGVALYFLYRPAPAKRRMVQALTWRIGLALFVFALLVLAWRAGSLGAYSQ